MEGIDPSQESLETAVHQESSPWVQGGHSSSPHPPTPSRQESQGLPKHSCSFPGISHQEYKAGPGPAGPEKVNSTPPTPAVNPQPSAPGAETPGSQDPGCNYNKMWPRASVTPDLLTRAPKGTTPGRHGLSKHKQRTQGQDGRTLGSQWGREFQRRARRWQGPPVAPQAAKAALQVIRLLLPAPPGTCQAVLRPARRPKCC